MTNAFQIRARDNSVTTESCNDKLIFERKEIGSDERDTRIVAVERGDKRRGFASRIVLEMDRTFGQENRPECVQLILDESGAGFRDELGVDFSLSDEDEFVGVPTGAHVTSRIGGNL